MAARYKPLSDQIRNAVDASGLSRYRISKETGISQTSLSRFMAGERGLPLSAIDTLGAFLNLEVVTRKRPRSK